MARVSWSMLRLMSTFWRSVSRRSYAEKPADLQALLELIEAGKVTPVVGRTFALPEAADALRYLEEGHAEGKVVVTV